MTKLEKFLREKGAYEAFVRNLYDIECYGSISEGEYYNLESCMEDVSISSAFIWRCTPEGSDYWRILTREFLDIE